MAHPGLPIPGFLISAVGLTASEFVETKSEPEQTGQ